jgi:hypothetical protein
MLLGGLGTIRIKGTAMTLEVAVKPYRWGMIMFPDSRSHDAILGS